MTPAALTWDDYRDYRISPSDPQRINVDYLQATLRGLVESRPDILTVRSEGQSADGREIQRVTIGHGDTCVLMWARMHGDEPTHTAVLLDLLAFLCHDPPHPWARELLAGCTLHMIPMLNPDGAERLTRHNSLDIDINRDARRLQTPEGRILRSAVENLQPAFAFNLHNQDARTAVGAPSRPAAVSLLVPPIDHAATETENTLAAKKMASCFRRAVESHCEGSISRYDANYMPRAFGEWIQNQGVATVLVEAGGSLSSDPRWLVQLHFLGLVSVLHAIATEQFHDVGIEHYESLPRSNSHPLFDLLVAGATVVNGLGHAPFQADIGINLPTRNTAVTHRAGVIQEIGDLQVTSGHSIVDATGLVCLPGRIALAANLTPCDLPEFNEWEELLVGGVTTAIGTVDLTNVEQWKAFTSLSDEPPYPVNVGFVAVLSHESKTLDDTLRERLFSAVAQGILGVVGNVASAGQRYCDLFGVPVIGEEQLAATAAADRTTIIDPLQVTSATVDNLRLSSTRGSIRRGSVADLLLLEDSSPRNGQETLSLAYLRHVLLAGHVVCENGRPTGVLSGRLLRRHYTYSTTSFQANDRHDIDLPGEAKKQC